MGDLWEDPSPPGTVPATAVHMAADIAARSKRLLDEMELLHQRYREIKGDKDQIRGLSVLMDALKAEREVAESFLATSTPHRTTRETAPPEAAGEAGLHPGRASWNARYLRGDSQTAQSRFGNSNVSSIQQHWGIIKHSRHVVSVHQQLRKTTQPQPDSLGGTEQVHFQKASKGCPLSSSYVHAIVDGGAEWVRIIGKGEKKLLIEMAEGGWEWGLDEDEDEDASLYEDIETLRNVKELVDKARLNWFSYYHPRIRIILTRIRAGQNKELDRLLEKLRRVGGDDITVTIHCADSEWVTNEPSIDTALSNMLPKHDDVAGTVVLDSSVMIGLVSDVSHTKVEKLPWHGGDVQGQIDDEQNGVNFLRSAAYPRLRGKKLVCTAQARDLFLKIVQPMGTPTEVERARILLEGGAGDLQEHSAHPVPDDLLLPVQVLPREDADLRAGDLVRDGVLPPIATEVDRHFRCGDANRSTHLYGWVAGLTVVTSNRMLARKIVRVVEASLTGEYENGPRVCVVPYNRALASNGPGPERRRQLAKKGLWPWPPEEQSEAHQSGTKLPSEL